MQYKNISTDNSIRPAILQIQVEDTVTYLIGKNVVAIGTVTFVGENGYQTKYGNVTVGSNKILFQITKVKMRNTKPPIRCNLISREFTLQDIFSNLDPPVIIINTSSIEKCINGRSENVTLPQDISFDRIEPEINLDDIVNNSIEESLVQNATSSLEIMSH